MSGDFKLDFERRARIGLDEALFCASKTVDQISAIVDAVKAKAGRMLLTRLDQSKPRLCSRVTAPASTSFPLPHGHSRQASSGAAHGDGGDCHGRNIRSAGRPRGGADARLRRSALSRIYRRRRRGPLAPARTDRRDPILSCRHRGRGHGRGAGQRRRRPGPGAIIALPTSVGYGVARGGETALHAALASCAPGITAVNIDNGYGAACAALRITRAIGTPQSMAEQIPAAARAEPN